MLTQLRIRYAPLSPPASDPVPLQGDNPDQERDDDGRRDRFRQPVAARDGEEDEARDDHEERQAPPATETAETFTAWTPITHRSAILDTPELRETLGDASPAPALDRGAPRGLSDLDSVVVR
jgi:hypothetical protein